MKTFKQFMIEMPYNVRVPRYDDRPEVMSNSDDVRRETFSTTPTHRFHREKFFNKHKYFDIKVSDHHGNVHFNISGVGNTKDKSFKVAMANGYKGRNIKYHQVIHHLISNGHINHWKSNVDHSPGSKKTYSELAKYPDLHVAHVDQRTGGATHATPDNIHKFYGREGRFEVTKK